MAAHIKKSRSDVPQKMCLQFSLELFIDEVAVSHVERQPVARMWYSGKEVGVTIAAVCARNCTRPDVGRPQRVMTNMRQDQMQSLTGPHLTSRLREVCPDCSNTLALYKSCTMTVNLYFFTDVNVLSDFRSVSATSKYTVNHKKRDILFLTITLAHLNRFLQFYMVLILKKFYMRLY